jgi:hypothetical protein
MRQLTILASAILLAACGDVVDESYGTWHEAKRAGAVERGWVPPFVPTTARDLRSVHNVDTNSQSLTFRLPPQAVQPMIDDIAPLSRVNGNILRRAINEVGGFKSVAITTAGYMICSNKYSAVLLIEPSSGNVAYLSPAEWGRGSCPRSL